MLLVRVASFLVGFAAMMVYTTVSEPFRLWLFVLIGVVASSTALVGLTAVWRRRVRTTRPAA